jgi:hypothetical protein
MGRLFLAWIVWVVFAGIGIAADPLKQMNQYDAGKLSELADQVALETKNNLKRAHYPDEVSQAMGQAQMDFLRILIRQNEEIIRQNGENLQLLRKGVR